MVQQLLKSIILLFIVGSMSCASVHTVRHTKYQKKNLRKFTTHARYFIKPFFTKHNKLKRKYIQVWKRGYYWHPAVPKDTRKRIRFAPWLKKIGEDELDL